MKILQINTSVNTGSTGRIAEDIGKVLIANGHESYIAFGRGRRPSKSELIKIGNGSEVFLHGIKTILFDRHGFGSKNATLKLIEKIEKLNPEVIGLHNLHGYYLNIQLLFDYLKKKDIPILWTLFDCWSFTGHCSYFDDIACEKWETGCFKCPKKSNYPASYLIDNSKNNYFSKREIFTNHPNLEIIVHSKWLKDLVKRSYLNNYTVHHIASGIDLDIFKPQEIKRELNFEFNHKKVVLGVASIWDQRKGLNDFLKLSEFLSEDIRFVLVGLSKKIIRQLPAGYIGIERTEDVGQLAKLYSIANVFVNPTWQDNFPTTNIEALACGTPVITYNTGGSPEAIDENTGIVVEKGNIEDLAAAIKLVINNGKDYYSNNCRARAVKFFNKDDRYQDYLALYEQLMQNQNV